MTAEAPEIPTPARSLSLAWEAGLLLVVLGLATFLRLDGVADIEPWIDEYGTSWAIAGDSFSEISRRVISVQGQSPLYYLATRAGQDLFPDPELGLRAFSLLCGLLLVPSMWWLARRVFRAKRAALGAALVVAVDERMIFYAQEARPYALALLGAVLSFIAFTSWCERDRRVARVLWVGATLLTWYAHYLFGMVILIQGLYVLLVRPHGKAGFRGFAYMVLAFTVLASPGLVHFKALFDRREDLDWIQGTLDLSHQLQLLLIFLSPLALAAAIPVVLAASWGSLGPRDVRGSRPGMILAWFVTPSLVCGFLPPLFDITLSHHRYVMLAAPAGLLLIGGALALPRTGTLKDLLPALVFVAATFVVALLPAHEFSGTWSRRQTQGWKEATGRLLEAYEPGDYLLYRTGFVELDAIVMGEASEDTEGFAAWPIAAHLPADLELPRQALPYSDEKTRKGKDPAMVDAVKKIIDSVWNQRRVWIVGSGAYVPELASWVTRHPNFELLRQEQVGIVNLMLFARK